MDLRRSTAHDHDGTYADAEHAHGHDHDQLPNATPGAVDTWTDWGPPLTAVVDSATSGTVGVHATLTGQVTFNSPTASRRLAQSRVAISLDGGATWDNGPPVRTELHGNDQRQTAIANQHWVSGPKSAGDLVHVQAQVRQDVLGSGGDLTFARGALHANQ